MPGYRAEGKTCLRLPGQYTGAGTDRSVLGFIERALLPGSLRNADSRVVWSSGVGSPRGAIA